MGVVPRWNWYDSEPHARFLCMLGVYEALLPVHYNGLFMRSNANRSEAKKSATKWPAGGKRSPLLGLCPAARPAPPSYHPCCHFPDFKRTNYSFPAVHSIRISGQTQNGRNGEKQLSTIYIHGFLVELRTTELSGQCSVDNAKDSWFQVMDELSGLWHLFLRIPEFIGLERNYSKTQFVVLLSIKPRCT